MTTTGSTPYRSYKDLPMIAGIASMVEAARPGLSIEACTIRLKRFHYAFKRLYEILTARITAEPIYELKTAFSHHSYLCSEHILALRTRVGEMRQPPLGLEDIPDTNLEVFFDEILCGKTTEELVLGVYEKALPAIQAGMLRHIADTNPLTDAPSIRVIRFALLELADMIAWGKLAIRSLITPTIRAGLHPYLANLDACLGAAGALDGVDPSTGVPGVHIASVTPYVYDPVPRRDERFQDLFNQGVNAESFIHSPSLPAQPKALMLLFKRLREIDVPEMMASIIQETKGQPADYYRDMSRQLWDEARHAMMGEVGFVTLGVDWTKARFTHNWSLRLNTQCAPLERHAVLYYIEQGLMGKTGKRFEWEVGQESGFPIMATIQDYDWADEVLHAQIGRAWLFDQLGGRDKAIEFGDRCWSRILSNYANVREQGLTRHESWWPAIYLDACRAWNQTPDPTVLGFAETYEGKRADLNTVAHSA